MVRNGRRSYFGYEAKRVMKMRQHRAATLSTDNSKRNVQREYEEEAKLVFRRSSFGRNNTSDCDSGSIWPRPPKPTAQPSITALRRPHQPSHPSSAQPRPRHTHTSYPSPPSFPPRPLSISRTRTQRCRSSSRSPTRHSETTGAPLTSTPWIRTPRPTSTAPRCTRPSRRFQSQRLGRLGSRLGSCCEEAMRRVR